MSAKRNAPSLVPILIYSGTPKDSVVKRFTDLGARVVFDNPDFLPPRLKIRSAQYLRLDAPKHASDLLHTMEFANVSREMILYTDTDVLFLKDMTTCTFTKPKVIALGGEAYPNHAFNTGVMLVSVEPFIQLYPGLLEYARSVNWTFYGGTLQDQGLINEFMFKKRINIDLLANEFNWKGYWGWTSDAAILHFHGLKASLKVFNTLQPWLR